MNKKLSPAPTKTEHLVFVEHDKPMTTSRLIAKTFGKQHKNVLRDIKNLNCSDNFTRLNFGLSNYKDKSGKENPEYHITKDGFTMLAFGYTGEKAMMFKEAYIERFNAMDAEIKTKLLQPPAPMQVQPVPDIFTKLKQEFNEKVATMVFNGTKYYKARDLQKLIYTPQHSGQGKRNVMGIAIRKAITEGDAFTIWNGHAHVYWINYFVVKETLENSKTRKGMLLHMALFEQGEPLPAPVLPESQVRVVINKLLKGREHGCNI